MKGGSSLKAAVGPDHGHEMVNPGTESGMATAGLDRGGYASVTKRRDTRPKRWSSRSAGMMVRDLVNDTPTPEASPPRDAVCPTADRLTVYFDGSCPLCRLEIAHYAAQSGAQDLAFVDVAASHPDTGPDLPRSTAMARFHVRLPEGRLLSGAAAFVEIWQRLPAWSFAARLARLPGALAALELAYRLFLPARPFLSRLVGWWQQRQPGQRQ